jgi:hypothetical protein
MTIFEITLDQYDSYRSVQFYREDVRNVNYFEDTVKECIRDFIHNLPNKQIGVDDIYDHVVESLPSYGYNKVEKVSISLSTNESLYDLSSHNTGRTDIQQVKEEFLRGGCKFLNSFLYEDQIESIIQHNSIVDREEFLFNFKLDLINRQEPIYFDNDMESILKEYNIDFSFELLDQIILKYSTNHNMSVEKIISAIGRICALCEYYTMQKLITEMLMPDTHMYDVLKEYRCNDITFVLYCDTINDFIDDNQLGIEFFTLPELNEEIIIFNNIFNQTFNQDI